MAPKQHHPAVADVLRHFEYRHLPEHLQAISRPVAELAHQMAEQLDGPQLTIGLQDLLRAKDAFVRAAVRPFVPLPEWTTETGATFASPPGAQHLHSFPKGPADIVGPCSCGLTWEQYGQQFPE